MKTKFTLILLSFFCSTALVELVSIIILHQYADLSYKLDHIFYRGAGVNLDVPPKKDSSEFRIFVYGGSTTAGEHLAKAGYVNQLKLQLKHILPQKNITIFNYGFSSFTSSDDVYLLKRTIQYNPDLVIEYGSHNEFILNNTVPYNPIMMSYLKRSAFFKLLITSSLQNTKELSAFHLVTTRIDKNLQTKKISDYAENLSIIKKITEAASIPLVLVAPVANISDWPPADETEFISSNKIEQYKHMLNDITHSLQSNEDVNIEQKINNFVSQFPESAMAIFLRGKLLEKNGNFNKAKSDYIYAKDYDLIPWRAPEDIHSVIHNLADNKRTYVADAYSHIESYADNNLVGYKYVIDNVHPTSLGNYYLTLTIIDTLKQNKLIPEIQESKNQVLPFEEIYSKLNITDRDHFEELLHAAKYTLLPPFQNFNRALQLLEMAEKYNKQDWSLYANLATVYFNLGEQEKAVSYIRKAAEIKRGPVNLHDYANAPALEFVLKSNDINLNVLGASIEKPYAQ